MVYLFGCILFVCFYYCFTCGDDNDLIVLLMSYVYLVCLIHLFIWNKIMLLAHLVNVTGLLCFMCCLVVPIVCCVVYARYIGHKQHNQIIVVTAGKTIVKTNKQNTTE